MDAYLVRLLPLEARELSKSADAVRQLINNVEHESNRFLSLEEFPGVKPHWKMY
jgi:hypothetical protein